MSWTIRQAAAGDAASLATFGRDLFIETYAHGTDPVQMRAYLDQHYTVPAVAQVLADPAITTLVVTGDGPDDWSGYAQIRSWPVPECVPDPTALQIWRFYVASRWHGRGLAGALMAACLDAMRARGAGTAWLLVWEHNARALAFYRKQGFSVVGEQIFRLADEEHLDPVLMRSLQ